MHKSHKPHKMPVYLSNSEGESGNQNHTNMFCTLIQKINNLCCEMNLGKQ